MDDIKTCVITGASGLIGSQLVDLLKDTWNICSIGRTAPDANGADARIRHLNLDLTQSWEVSMLPPVVDSVIHLAQAEHFRDFPERTEQVFQINTASTLRLLNYAVRAGARTFVVASSGGIYGYGEHEFSEDVTLHSRGDLGFYLGTKLCSEILAENYTDLLNVIVLRFFFVYGVRQRRTMLIPRLVQSVIDQRSIILHGEDGIRLNPTHVSDAANAVLRALDLNASHKINVAGPEVLTMRQIGHLIGMILGQQPTFDVQLGAEPRHLVGDIRKMGNLLETPKIRFEEGIAAYVREIYGDPPITAKPRV